VLGPVPEDPLERAEWTRRAGVIAGYREQHGWIHATDAIGPAPHRSAAEDRAGWHTAWTALGRPDEHRDVAAATRGELANTIQAWERTEAVAPANVDDELRKAHRVADFCDREARYAHARIQTGADPQAAARVEQYRRQEGAARARAAELEAAAAARAAWYEQTTAQRRRAELARVELGRRDERALARLAAGQDPTAEPAEPAVAREPQLEVAAPTPARPATRAEQALHEIQDQRQQRDLAPERAEPDAPAWEPPTIEPDAPGLDL
jgi:hypothetical protein